MIRYYTPHRIIDCLNVANPDNLFKKQDLQIGLGDKILSSVTGKGHIILDFKKEIRGGIRILTSSTSNGGTVRIRIRFGESLSEASSEIEEGGATNDHSPRDFETILSKWSDVTYGESGFRFVRIDFLDDIEFNIKSILAKSYESNKKTIYQYNGLDKRIKKIYDIAKRTIDLCTTDEFIWDGIKRDRLVWIGDMHPEMLSTTTLYGRSKELENSLRFTSLQFSSNEFICGMPTYSLWFVIIVCDYYKKTKDKEFIGNYLDYINGVLSNFKGMIGSDGSLSYGDDGLPYFVDWPTVGSVDEMVGATIITRMAFEKGSGILSEFGLDTTEYTSTIENLKKVPLDVVKQKQVLGLKYYLLGSISDIEYEKLTRGGADGFSTFMSYYILKAIASKNKETAIDLMKEYYGAMLDLGATSFFEDFEMAWAKNACPIDKMPKKGQIDFHKTYGKFCYTSYRHSLCHGWSSGVLAFIKEECE